MWWLIDEIAVLCAIAAINPHRIQPSANNRKAACKPARHARSESTTNGGHELARAGGLYRLCSGPLFLAMRRGAI